MIAFTPESLGKASIYQIFARNYTREGTLKAAAQRLREVAELGFDLVYLTPVHPIGELKRKGVLGSPYAIADYRAVDGALGGEEGLRSFIDEAHRLGLGVIMDVVYNHTAPDSLLAREKPEWFWKGSEGKPGPRVADWSDVADLDYSRRDLWEYQIATLEKWARFGADGFRCDVASLVPVEFWVEARSRLSAIKPLIWLAESVHKEFVRDLRRAGMYAASDPELHAAFDITYDYDGREELEAAWKGEGSLGYYLKLLEVQECLYPAGATKLRFLENHDQVRAASRFDGARLRNWTALAMLLPGTFMAYMGQELALRKRIGLFDLETMDEKDADRGFRAFFSAAHALSRKIKAEAPIFDAVLLAEGLVMVTRSAAREGAGSPRIGAATAPRYVAILNLDGRSGSMNIPSIPPLEAGDLLDGREIALRREERGGARLDIGPEPAIMAAADSGR